MSWVLLVWKWLVGFFGAAAKVEYLVVAVAECKEVHKKCEEAHKKCEEKYDILEDTVKTLDAKLFNATVIADETGKIIDFSMGACKLFSWAKDQAIGHNIEILVPYEDKAKHAATFRAAAESRKVGALSNVEVMAMTRNGDKLKVRIVTAAWISDGKWYVAAEIKETTGTSSRAENGDD